MPQEEMEQAIAQHTIKITEIKNDEGCFQAAK